jgi:DNA repair exonuclease SbcCD ATPase subunit
VDGVRHLKFHYAKAQNILCFGEDGIELHFTDHGHIIQIYGENLDLPGTSANPASNASGKSSIQELLSIGLYGKQVKDPKKLKGNNIVNVLANKGLVEVQFDAYRVVRTLKRTPSGVTSKVDIWESPDHIWDNDSKVTLGKGTQKWIEDKIGLNHFAFCSVIILEDSNKHAFLELDTPTKREFVENLLGLDKYRQYFQNAKDFLKDQKKLVAKFSEEYQLLQQQVGECGQRISKMKEMEKSWEVGKKREMKELFDSRKTKEAELENTDIGEQLSRWEQAQAKVEELNASILKYEANKGKITGILTEARVKLDASHSARSDLKEAAQGRRRTLQSFHAELQKHMALASQLEGLEEGTICPTCHGVITSENYGHVLRHSFEGADDCRNKIHLEEIAVSTVNDQIKEKSGSIVNMEASFEQAEAKLSRISTGIVKMQGEVTELTRLPKPEGDAALQVLESQITALRQQLKAKKDEFDGGSPYTEILAQTEVEKTQKEAGATAKGKELEAAEKEIPYIQYWVKAFGDGGIRKYVVDGIIPALNARIGYWMQFLIEGKMELIFDNALKAAITRNGNPVDYSSTSNGEKRRINLAVSQAFAYVMMLNSGSCPSLVFLDEITGGGIDRSGVVGVYNMIFELAKERQVFVTTHNENLLSMLQGCEKIKLRKQNDITVLA